MSLRIEAYLVMFTAMAPYARGDNVTVLGGQSEMVLLKDLEEDTVYNVTVQSMGTNIVSGFSEVVSAMTFAAGELVS